MHFVAGLALLLGGVASPLAADHESRPTEPFAVAGVSHAEAADFLKRLQQAIADQDANAVAALTEFPVTVNGKRGPKDRAEFAQHFASIYTSKVRAAVLAQRVDGLFANWRALMIGHGEVWISALCDSGSGLGCKNRRIRVISVNNSETMVPSNNRWRGP